ncbi:hypothetical protein [Oceanibaculum pacificum]|uniref:hypothetical protein n=1 Tax=Oceanibaculum pacificum TaxID=580166 RepID=UPI0018DD93F8|nr:hypothetical protein [Oceanibaculum pacificum]
MMEKEKSNSNQINNWILVFDWSDGNFVTWDIVGRDADEAVKLYMKYESDYPEEEKYEVVMIGSSDISTVPQTHSHYFGIDHHNAALEGMEKSIIGLSRRSEVDIGSRRILLSMKKRKLWGKRYISVETLKNHFCQNVATFDTSLEFLKKNGYIIGDDPISLDIKKNRDIGELV